MSGERILVDINVFIYLLNGDATAARFLREKDIFISFITEIELLSYKEFSGDNQRIINQLIDSTTIVHSNEHISRKAAEIRREYRLALPDAIIASTADFINTPLISADKSFLKIDDIRVVEYRAKAK
jgi:predicted nucleic acid-binding protein